MKKLISLFVAAAMITGIGACSSKSSESASEDSAAEKTITSPEAGPDGIVTLSTDDYYTPGIPVDRLTVIDFNAVWCGPCRQLKPVFHEAAKNFEGKATFVSVDIDSLPRMMGDFNLEPVVPTVLFIHPDGTYESYVGTGDLLPYEKFAGLIDKHLGHK